MEIIEQLVVALVGVLAALPAAYFSAKAQITKGLNKRLNDISGGQVSTVEDLVAAALAEARIRATPIAVSGGHGEQAWAELRRGGFSGAALAPTSADVAVVHITGDGDPEAISQMGESYVLIYKTGAPYRGALPPGANVTFANSPVSLEARLLELLRYRASRTS